MAWTTEEVREQFARSRADAAELKLGRIRRYLNDPTSLVVPGEPRIVSVDGVLRYLDGLQ